MIEKWLPVEGYEGLYKISNFGRICSLHYSRERILKQFLNNKGYWVIGLNKDARHKTFLVSRLVGKAFLSNPMSRSDINHIDYDPKNNRVDNLEWVTHKKNVSHSKHRMHTVHKKVKVDCFDLAGSFLGTFDSIKDAALTTGQWPHSIRRCLIGETDRTKKYLWRLHV